MSAILLAVVPVTAVTGAVWYYISAVHDPTAGKGIDEYFGSRGIVIEFAYENQDGTFEFLHTDIAPHRKIAYFNATGDAFNDADLLHLSRLARCQDIYDLTVRSDSVTNRGIAHISALRSLEYLSVTSSHVDDGAIPYLASLAHLRRLTLIGCRMITGRQIGCLATLPDLTYLSLTLTALSDSSIPELSKFGHLVELHIGGTELSDRGIERLRNDLPDTWVQEY